MEFFIGVIVFSTFLFIIATAWAVVQLRDRFDMHIRDDKRHLGEFGKTNRTYTELVKDGYISEDEIRNSKS